MMPTGDDEKVLQKIFVKLDSLENAIKGDRLGNEGLAKRVAKLEQKIDEQQGVLKDIKTGLSVANKAASVIGGTVGAFLTFLTTVWSK
jgi:hypothetical protein